MEEGFPFRLASTDFCFSLLSLLLFLADIMLDLWAIVSLYEEQNYFSMGFLIILLLSSSVLLQIFSWLWYADSTNILETKVEKFICRHGLLTAAHVFQFGIFLRFAAVLEVSCQGFIQGDPLQKGLGVYLNHDLSMLRLFEAFSESATQIVLMMALIVEMQELHLFTVVKILGSLSSLSFTVMSYHRNMRAFLPEKHKMGWSSSIIYFLWNLFLIGPRVMCVSLFASVLPCYVPAHFLSLWMLLVLWAWWQKTDFMDSKAGEWLYRATVALIWYFSWFSVTSGSTKHEGIIYHTVMGVDTMLLLGLWWWRRSVESAQLTPLPINIYGIILILITSYIVGVLLKLLYYWKFHPKRPDLQIHVPDGKSSVTPLDPASGIMSGTFMCFDTVDVPDGKSSVAPQDPASGVTDDSRTYIDFDTLDIRERNKLCLVANVQTYLLDSPETLSTNQVPGHERKEPCRVTSSVTQTVATGVNKRMKNMAMNFYC